VTLAELEAADEAAGISATVGNILQLNDFMSSHLDDNRPPFCEISEPVRSPIMPVGDGFGFIRFIRW
jgi:hypothetical protein